MSAIPEGFDVLPRTSPFTQMIGPIYQKKDPSGLIIGLLVEEKHCNARGLAHGGVLGTLADIAMGYSAAFSTNPPTALVTTSQTMDYMGKAKIGDWLEVHTEVQKVGRTLAFAHCQFMQGAQSIARSTAVFSVLHS